MSTQTTKTSRKGAIKGTVAAAAGLAVLLGGAGTFALWNANGDIGTADAATGHLTAEFGTVAWQDVTPGHENAVGDVSAFQMAPGDNLEGTATITVDAQGENIVVKPTIDYGAGTLPTDVTVDVTLTDADGEPVTTLTAGDDQQLTATVDVTFDSGATGSMNEPIKLSDLSIALDQVAPSS